MGIWLVSALLASTAVLALLAGFWVGWLCCRTWYRFESGWREVEASIDEERRNGDDDGCGERMEA